MCRQGVHLMLIKTHLESLWICDFWELKKKSVVSLLYNREMGL